MGLLVAAGFDRITSGQELELYTDFDAGVASEVTSVQEDIIRQGAGEQWLSPGNSSSTSRFVDYLASIADGGAELEFSCSMHINPTRTPTTGTVFASLHGTSTSSMIEFRAVNNPAGGPPVIEAGSAFGFIPSTLTSFLVIAGQVYNFTLRGKTDPNNAGRARYELYINGTQVYGDDNRATGTPFNGTGSDFRARIRPGTSGGYARYRNITVRDEWSTPDDVPPTVPYVIDLTSTTVTAPDYTTSGGAATLEDAINDNDQSTGIRSDIANAVADLELALPADLEGLSVLGVHASVRAGRLTPDPTTLKVDLLDDAGAELATLSQGVSIASPGRESVDLIYDNVDGADAVSSEDIAIRLTNVTA